jgi:hypothetical protein
MLSRGPRRHEAVAGVKPQEVVSTAAGSGCLKANAEKGETAIDRRLLARVSALCWGSVESDTLDTS